MISKRRSKPFKMVSIHDPAFRKLEPAVRTRYGISRDFSVLPIEKMTDPKPTVFKVSPLQTKYDNMIDTGADYNTMLAIFQTHVQSVENFTDERGQPVLEMGPDGRGGEIVSDDSMKHIPWDVVQDVVNVCVSMGRQDTRPFIMPDISQEIKASHVLASFVKAANTGSASE